MFFNLKPCLNCGARGIFIRINNDELCKNCASIIRGRIKYHNLIPFWLSLSQEERQKCIVAYEGTGIATTSSQLGVISGNIGNTSETRDSFLNTLAYNLMRRKEHSLALIVLAELEHSCSSLTDLHFCYNTLIELTYKQRSIEGFLDLCIQVCLKDIDIFPKFEREWLNDRKSEIAYWKTFNEERGLKGSKRYHEISAQYERHIENGIDFSIPSFRRLAIIYEKQYRFGEAIDICDLALSYGIIGDYEKRLERLYKKQSRPPKGAKRLLEQEMFDFDD